MSRDPCLCGDPECRSCFPGPFWEDFEDEDEAYERWRQDQIDDTIAPNNEEEPNAHRNHR